MRARTLAPLQVSICCFIVDVKSSKSQRKMMPTHIFMFSLNHSTFNVSHVRIIKRQQWNRTKQSKLGNWIEQTHISPPLFAVQSVVCSLLCTTQCKFYVCIECARSYACVCVHEYTRALRLIRTHANGARPQLMSASAYFIFQHINIMKCVVSRQPIVESTGWMCAFSQTKKKCSRFSFHHKIHRRFCVCVCSTEAAPAPTSSLPLALCLCASEVYVWVFEIVCFFLLVLWFVISTTVGIHRIVQEYIREMKLRVHVYVYMIDACLLLVLNCIRVWLAVSNTSTDFVDNTSNTQSHFTVNKI